MGKGDSRGRSYQPPTQRNNTGKFNAKVGRKENKETETQAIARKQEPFPYRKVLLWLAIFGAASACLYAYLNFVLADDDDAVDA